MKEVFYDRVIYTLSFQEATPQDSGTYECSIVHVISGDVRVSSVSVTVFGESTLSLLLDAASEESEEPKDG